MAVWIFLLAAGLQSCMSSPAGQSQGRKMFGGYHIMPRACRGEGDVSGMCMFNYECARRGGAVVGSCMDGFLFGACCNLPPGADTTPDDLDELSEADLVTIRDPPQPLPSPPPPTPSEAPFPDVSPPSHTYPAADTVLVHHNGSELLQVNDPDDFRPTPGSGLGNGLEPETDVLYGSEERRTTFLVTAGTPTEWVPLKPVTRPTSTPPPTTLIANSSFDGNQESIFHILSLLNDTEPNAPPASLSTWTSAWNTEQGVTYQEVPLTTRPVPAPTVIVLSPLRPEHSTRRPPTRTPPTTTLVTKLTVATTTDVPEPITSVADLANFPPVRNPQLNSSFTQAEEVAEDDGFTTPQFADDDKFHDKIETLVNKLVQSLEGNFHDLEDVLYKRKNQTGTTTRRPPANDVLPSTSRRPAPASSTTPKPPRRTKPTTVGPNTTPTRRPSTSTRRPTIAGSGATPTRRPTTSASRPTPSRRPTTPSSNPTSTRRPTTISSKPTPTRRPTTPSPGPTASRRPTTPGPSPTASRRPTTASPSPTASRRPTTPSPSPSTSRRPTTGISGVTRPTNITVKPRPRPTKKPTTVAATQALEITTTPSTTPSTTVASSTTTTTTVSTTSTPITTSTTAKTDITTEETTTAKPVDFRNECGVRPHMQNQVKSGRIVGGKGATFGEWPWQVLVRESTWLGLFTKNKCGGVLITSKYVVTAAHCQPGFLANLVAVMGDYDITGPVESKTSVTKNVRHVIVHRSYDAATFANDLALLELESPVQFDTHIVPICMPNDKDDFTGRMATVTGWGRLKYGGGVPSVLQEVQVPIIENSVCQEMFQTAGHSKVILNSFLCAGYANGQKDSCEGDSGGPLMLERDDGRWVLAGTVSHGIKCASPYLPGVYMRTTFYKPWLQSITGVQ